MPIVPYPQRQAGLAPMPGPRLSPDAPAAAFPGAVNTGLDLSGVRSVVDRIHAEEVQKANQIRVLDGVAQAGQLKNQIIGQVLQSRGKESFGAPEAARAQWEQGVSSISATMTPDQQDMFRQHATAEGLDLGVTVQRHVADEMARVTNGTFDALDTQYGNDALTHASLGDYAGVDLDVEKRAAAITQRAALTGLSDAQRDLAIQEATSQTRLAVFRHLSDTGQDLQASAYLEKYRSQFTGSDLADAEKVDAVGSVRAASQRESDDITSHATDLTSALAEAGTITDSRVREATERRIRQHYEDVATNTRQTQTATFNKLAGQLRDNGGDYEALPPGDRDTVSPEQTASLLHLAGELRNPVARTNVATYTHLVNLASVSDATRAEFTKLDLAQYANKLSEPDMRYLVWLQGSIRSGGTGRASSPENSVRRKEETVIVQQSKDAAKRSAAISAAEKLAPGSGQYLPPVARVHPPQWMIDSAANDPEYRRYLTMQGVPLGSQSAPANQKPGNIDLSTLPPPPRVPGAPIVPLSPTSQQQPPSEFTGPDIGQRTATITGGHPTIINSRSPRNPQSPGEYIAPSLATKGDTLYLGKDANAPADFVASHEWAHRLFSVNEPGLPDDVRPKGNRDPALEKIIKGIQDRGGYTDPSESFAQAFSEAMRGLFGSGAFGPDSSTAHRANPKDVAVLRKWIQSKVAQ